MKLIRFQFLLVRLRDSRRQYRYARRDISIPSGAIKSQTRRIALANSAFISIPSGAIKSITERNNFETVNLISIPSGAIKSEAENIVRYSILISIPSGAIKSVTMYVLPSTEFSFQFLLVRLRV